MKDEVEDPGGDLRAVEGTNADVAITTDRPLANGILMLDDGSKLTLRSGPDGLLMATVPIQKDGLYHIAALEGGDDVRLSEDYFIEAQQDKPPEIKITRPGRDSKASPIEEVTVQVEAKDDFGLQERRAALLRERRAGEDGRRCRRAARAATGTSTIALEDFKLEPGDVVSMYATAKDARTTTEHRHVLHRSAAVRDATTRSRSRPAAVAAAAAATRIRTRSRSARRKSSRPPGIS